MGSDVIRRLGTMEGVVTEVCGSFLWLSGNTYAYRHEIKAMGFKWARGKRKWYLAPKEWAGSRGNGWSMDRIRAEHGSRVISRNDLLAMGA